MSRLADTFDRFIGGSYDRAKMWSFAALGFVATADLTEAFAGSTITGEAIASTSLGTGIAFSIISVASGINEAIQARHNVAE